MVMEVMLMQTELTTLWDCLGQIPDPRNASGRRFSLQSILALIIAGLLCGKLSLRAIARWGRRLAQEDLKLIGISRDKSPSQSSMHYLLTRIDVTAMEKSLGAWIQSLSQEKNLHIAIDGKTLKGSASEEYKALHLLAAYCTNISGVLSQIGLDSKEGEITGAKKILSEIPVCENIISGDAIFCQTEICRSIVQEKGEYIFMVKGNQPSLQEDITTAFSGTISPEG
jgi:hypothetical protein